MAGLKASLRALANLFSLRLGAKWKALAIRDPLQLGVPTQAGSQAAWCTARTLQPEEIKVKVFKNSSSQLRPIPALLNVCL